MSQAAQLASRATFLGLTGETDLAFDLLELAITTGRLERWIRSNPDLAPLHADPRWPELAAELDRRLESSEF